MAKEKKQRNSLSEKSISVTRNLCGVRRHRDCSLVLLSSFSFAPSISRSLFHSKKAADRSIQSQQSPHCCFGSGRVSLLLVFVVGGLCVGGGLVGAGISDRSSVLIGRIRERTFLYIRK